MEESAPDGTEVADPAVVRQQLRDDLSAAVASRDAGVAELRDRTSALSRAAYADQQAGADLLRGQIDLSLDKSVQPLVKYVDKRKGELARGLTSAYQTLYSVGAEPPIHGPDVASDIARDDPYASASQYLLAPILGRQADAAPIRPAGVMCPEGGPYTGPPDANGCPTMVLPGGGSALSPPPAVPPAVPPTDTPVSLPTAGYTCPAPVVVCPTPPPPVVYLAPPGWTGPPAVPPTAPPPITSTVPPGVPPGAPRPVLPPVETAPPPRPVDPPDGTPVEIAPAPRPVPPTEIAPPPRPVVPPRPVWRPAGLPMSIPPQGGAGNWSDPVRCRTIQPSAQVPPPALASGTITTAERFYGEVDSAIAPLVAGALGLIGIDLPTNWKPLRSAIEGLESVTTGIISSINNNPNTVTLQSVAIIAAAGFSEKWTFAPATYLAQSAMYDLQHENPQFLPSQAQVNNLRLTNKVDLELWTCLTKANGNHPWAQDMVVASQRTHLPLADAIALYRRREISWDDLVLFGKYQGVLVESELRAMVSAGEFVPTYTDITRFMVRDSADEQIVAEYRYDELFRDKFTPKMREWATAQGISEDVFRYIWRAHWQLPSPTQLYEMLHRLRPGVADESVSITADQVKQALITNDMSPAFVDRLMAVSYSVITRTDLLAFYTSGAYTHDDVVSGLMDTGYNAEDASAVADAWKIDVANRRANKTRLFTRLKIVGMYISGELGRDKAGELLTRTVPSADERTQILDDCDLRREIGRKKVCMKAVHTRRMQGELSEQEERRELVAMNVDPMVAATLAESHTCELASKSKEPAVAMLKDWFLGGLIDVALFDRRLRNLRYTPTDAQRIIQAVILHEQDRLATLRQKAAEKAAARAEKTRREAERKAEAKRKSQEKAAEKAKAAADKAKAAADKSAAGR